MLSVFLLIFANLARHFIFVVMAFSFLGLILRWCYSCFFLCVCTMDCGTWLELHLISMSLFCFREFLRAGAQASAENARWLEALTTGAEEAPEAAAAAAAAGATDAQGDSSSSLGADAANLAAYLLAVAEEEARTAAADAPPAPAAASRDVAAASASVSTTATKAQLQNGASSHSPSSSSGRVSDGVIDHFPAGPSGGGGGDGAATAAAAAIEAATPLVLEDEDSGVSSNDSLFAVNVGGVDDEGFGRWADDEVAVSHERARESYLYVGCTIVII